MDIYPTLLAEVGLSLPYEIQGKNLFEKPKQRLIFIKGHLGTRSVVYNNYHMVKVLPNLSKQLDLETDYFFDIHDDPLEKNNVAANRKDLQNFMDEKYMEFYNKHGYLDKINEDKKPSLSKKELENLKALGYIR
jgi:arylsulfatase A-like enzyme